MWSQDGNGLQLYLSAELYTKNGKCAFINMLYSDLLPDIGQSPRFDAFSGIPPTVKYRLTLFRPCLYIGNGKVDSTYLHSSRNYNFFKIRNKFLFEV